MFLIMALQVQRSWLGWQQPLGSLQLDVKREVGGGLSYQYIQIHGNICVCFLE